MDGLCSDLWSEVCLYLDVCSLAKFEQSHKSCDTTKAWARVLQTRFQLSLVNRQYLLANPRYGVQLLMKMTDHKMFRMDTLELLQQSNSWRQEVERLTRENGTAPFVGGMEFTRVTPTVATAPVSLDVYAEPLVQHWFRVRELAQRGIVNFKATLAELRVGHTIVHYICKKFGQSPSGLSQSSQYGATIKYTISRVDAVCNGVVQFREFTHMDPHHTDPHGTPRCATGAIGWAMRCDMLVVCAF
jgi:hypothetical protein